MITLDLSPEIESRIARIAENWGRDPSAILAEAVEHVLEDAEDIAAAEQSYREYLDDPSSAVPFSVIRAELGL